MKHLCSLQYSGHLALAGILWLAPRAGVPQERRLRLEGDSARPEDATAGTQHGEGRKYRKRESARRKRQQKALRNRKIYLAKAS